MSCFDTLFYKRALDFERRRLLDVHIQSLVELEDIKQKSLAQLWDSSLRTSSVCAAQPSPFVLCRISSPFSGKLHCLDCN